MNLRSPFRCINMECTDDIADTAVNPSVIIELLSKLTRSYDKGKKFLLYRDIASLWEYILIDTEMIYVEKHIGKHDNSWQLTEFKTLENSFSITTVDISLSLKDIYEGLFF